MNRIQFQKIVEDLQKKMVFLVGPRQVGKTWLAKYLAQTFSRVAYLNYDHLEDRKIIQNESWLASTELLILDELHKMPGWKNYLKGVFDTKKENLKILVTGSARLDIFTQVGDSLAGRFFIHRLLPFSPAELFQLNVAYEESILMQRGGFPEPFLAENDIEAQRWRMQYIDSLTRIDLLELAEIHDLRALQLTLSLLQRHVGSPVSYQSISEDVGVSPNTIKKYIQVLEALYIIFRVTPYSNNIARSLVKEPKLYFYDNGMVLGDNGAKLENMVAVSLLKHTYAQQDYLGKRCALHYLRTKDKREVDFALIENETIHQIIEVKYSDKTPSSSLVWFHKKYQLPAIQIVSELKQAHQYGDIAILTVRDFLEHLYL